MVSFIFVRVGEGRLPVPTSSLFYLRSPSPLIAVLVGFLALGSLI